MFTHLLLLVICCFLCIMNVYLMDRRAATLRKLGNLKWWLEHWKQEAAHYQKLYYGSIGKSLSGVGIDWNDKAKKRYEDYAEMEHKQVGKN